MLQKKALKQFLKEVKSVFVPEPLVHFLKSDFVQFLIEEIRGQIEKSLMEADDEGN